MKQYIKMWVPKLTLSKKSNIRNLMIFGKQMDEVDLHMNQIEKNNNSNIEKLWPFYAYVS